jgi:hypothetical protein
MKDSPEWFVQVDGARACHLKTPPPRCITLATERLARRHFQAVIRAHAPASPLDDFRCRPAAAGAGADRPLHQQARVLQSVGSGGGRCNRTCRSPVATTLAERPRRSGPRTAVAECIGSCLRHRRGHGRYSSLERKCYARRRARSSGLLRGQRGRGAARPAQTPAIGPTATSPEGSWVLGVRNSRLANERLQIF